MLSAIYLFVLFCILLRFSNNIYCIKSSPVGNVISSIVSIGNHRISSAIWDQLARVNFSKTNQIARARRASAICSL